MRQTRRIVSGPAVAPWIVAGALLLGMGAPTSAQDATPAPVDITTETPTASADSQAEAVGGGHAPSAMPSAGVGPGLAAGGTGPLSLGALVGAGVAAVFALRERLKKP